ncbi:hypothetical protein ACFL59_02515 [Planctomycetota bacterium]
MEINDLVQIVLDPNLGVAWPSQLDFEFDWHKGRKWRVEYAFSSPAVPVAALAVGNEVRGVWRYEVVEVGDDAEGKPTVTLRISPERRGFEGYHFLVTYARSSLQILSTKRFEGPTRLPFELRPLPPLQQAVARLEDGRSFTRTFTMQEPKESPEAGDEGEEESFEGQDEIFAGAEPVE